MKEAKDTDDSLEFLRSFEKYATNTELGELVFKGLTAIIKASTYRATGSQKLNSKIYSHSSL